MVPASRVSTYLLEVIAKPLLEKLSIFAEEG